MIKGATLNKGGSRLPLILGLILGLVAAGLVVVYLSSAKDEGGTVISTGGGGVDTVVAAQNIAANTKITPEMLRTTGLPEGDRLADAFGSTEGLVGKVTRVAISQNEQLSQSKVIGSDVVGSFGSNPPLSVLVDPGTRAVSAKVSSVIGAGGNIRPGDYVDVILIVEVKINSGEVQFNDTVAGTILQNVKVLAIDTERTNPDPAASTDPDEAKEENDAATTVTLSLSPSHAEVLAVADACGEQHGGRLALALRGPGDTVESSNRTEWPQDGDIPSCIALLGVATLGD